MNSFQFFQRRPLAIVLSVAIAVALIKAVILGAGMEENFAKMGNDDILRMVMVRDWMAGQAWFDTGQYRLVPPEGVLIHWSRYVDAGIAAFIVPLAWFMPLESAELVAAAIWPTLIFIAMLAVVGLGTRRVFGASAACFAVLCTVFWPLLADLHVRPGNLDHHNVQLLLMFVMVFAVIWPARAVVSGVVAGAAGALSLAVGLENLVFVIVGGLILVVQSSMAKTDHARGQLIAFCAALAVLSVVFWIGQAPDQTRFAPICDQLGTPILSLVWIAAIASVLPVLILPRTVSPVLAIGATTVLTLVGLAVAWPLIGPCLAGPYASLTPELQTFISGRITEAKPLIAYAIGQPAPAFVFLSPIFAALILGLILWIKDRGSASPQHAALGKLMVFCIFGTALIFYQTRTFTLAATVVPMIGGVVIARLLANYLRTRDATAALMMFAIQIVFIAPTTLAEVVRPLLPQTPVTGLSSAGECRTYASLQSLNAVPPAVILTNGNFGPSLLWATHHSALAGPYHRSPTALTNSMLPFGMADAEMAAFVRQTGATHLLMCKGYVYEGAFSRALAEGAGASWLRRVPLADDAQVLYEIIG